MKNIASFEDEYFKKIDLDLKKIKNILGKERYNHTLLVTKAALKLAENQKQNQNKVLKAALLHDIAKNKSEQELKSLLRNSKFQPDELEMSIVPVLHAPAGAVIAEKEFAIEDKEILEAIRFHSLGHPEMGKLAQLIYAADFISEDRNFNGLNKIRGVMKSDFEEGLYLITNHILKYQLEQDNFIHPFSNNFRNKLVRNKFLKRSDL